MTYHGCSEGDFIDTVIDLFEERRSTGRLKSGNNGNNRDKHAQ
jgi:hypothetical protein